MKRLLFLLFLYCSCLFAGNEAGFKYGLGILVHGSNNFAEVKHFSFYYQNNNLQGIFSEKLEVGLWADNRNNSLGHSSAYLGYSWGVRVDTGGIYGESLFGIAGNTHTDGLMSTNVNFMIDTGLGFKDELGRGIGINYKHLSNAGITLPNYGRDFISLQIFFGF